MNQSSILNLGGNIDADNISRSHLGSGSPKPSPDAYHSKRAKHHSEDSNNRITQLKAKIQNEAIEILFSGNTSRSYALIYRDVERLCLTKHSEEASMAVILFNEIDRALSNKILPSVTDCLHELTEGNIETKAKRFLQIYTDWDKTLRLLSQVFLYLDRSYLFHHPRNPCIREYGIKQFMVTQIKDKMSTDFNAKTHDPIYTLVFALLEKTMDDRSNSALCDLTKSLIVALSEIDPQNMTNVNHSLSSIFVDVYSKSQKKWLKNKKTYVSVFMDNIVDTQKVLNEAKKTEEFIEKLGITLIWKFLISDLNLYLEPSLPHLILPENLSNLSIVTGLCERSMKTYGVDSIKILLTIWGKFIQEQARRAIQNSEVVQSILKVWREFSTICQKAFMNKLFEFEIRSSLQKVLGEKTLAFSTVFHLSKYCDNAMKQGNMSSRDFADLEDDVLTVFKLISDKRTFLSVYEKDLSRRILMARNFNYDFERKLVEAIVSVVGENDENFKLRAMLRDYSKSKSSFSHLRLPVAPKTDLSALVLEKKVWPEIPGFGPDVKLPQPLTQTLTDFERYYMEMDEKKHKTLDWKSYTLHQLTLTTQFASEAKELQVNLSQAAVLMLFEDVDSHTFSEILDATKMSEKLIRRVLTSLSTEKYPILKVDADKISFNHNFDDKAHKIKLPMGKEKEVAVTEGVKKLVDEGRSSETRSVIVRMMKSHRRLLFTELLGKTIEQLSPRGVPQIQDIKNEIENLISTEYIARDETGSTLNYIP